MRAAKEPKTSENVESGPTSAKEKGLYSPSERKHLAAETLAADTTIVRWMRGEPIRDSLAATLTRAAKKLGLPVPVRKVMT